MNSRLNISGVVSTLDVRLQEAAGHNLSHLGFLELILQDEFNIHGPHKLSRCKKTADFRACQVGAGEGGSAEGC